MIDISDKIKTLRYAKAVAFVRVSPRTIDKIRRKEVPKGDVLEVSRATAILAVKRLSEILPFCHNIPILWVGVNFSLDEDKIGIEVEVKTIAQTGCEMEALFGAMIAAVNIYDMIKPIDKEIEILSAKVVEKSGGKSDFEEKIPDEFKVGVLVVSDSVFQGKKSDKSGKIIVEKLEEIGVKRQNIEYKIVPDEIEDIRREVLRWVEIGYDLVLITGGTGLSPRDRTPEAVKPLIEREIPGIMESSRMYGIERTPYAMLSRGISGMSKKTLIITLPGSSRGVRESMNALFPYVLHIFRILKMARHD